MIILIIVWKARFSKWDSRSKFQTLNWNGIQIINRSFEWSYFNVYTHFEIDFHAWTSTSKPKTQVSLLFNFYFVYKTPKLELLIQISILNLSIWTEWYFSIMVLTEFELECKSNCNRRDSIGNEIWIVRFLDFW